MRGFRVGFFFGSLWFIGAGAWSWVFGDRLPVKIFLQRSEGLRAGFLFVAKLWVVNEKNYFKGLGVESHFQIHCALLFPQTTPVSGLF